MAKQPKTNTQVGDYNYFRTSLTIGYDYEGKPIKRQFYGINKGEAENKKRAYQKQLEEGINPDLASQTLLKSIHDWLWTIERSAGNKTSTFERYEGIYRKYIRVSSIGQMQISSINKVAILKYYNELIANGSSYSIVATINKLLNKFFRYALSEGYIPRNPLTGLRLPRDNEEVINEDESVVETFSDEELKQIISAAGNTKLKYIVMFAVLTGARIGEILALEKKDIKNGIVKINKSVRVVKVFIDETNYKNVIKVTTPKTKSSNREIPIPEVLQKELKNLSKLVKEEKLKLGPAYTQNTLLFPSLTGTYMDSSNIRTGWKRALSNSGIEYKKFHSLRHTYGTRMTEKGVMLLTVSRLMGHGSIKTTEIYAHTSQDTKIEAANTLNSMFN